MKKKIDFTAETYNNVIAASPYYRSRISPFLRVADNEADVWKENLSSYVAGLYATVNSLEKDELIITISDTQLKIDPPEGTEGVAALILNYTTLSVVV